MAAIAMALLASSWLSAYQFSPLEQTFEPSGGGATRTYTIVNDSDDTIAVRISALTRDQDADGGETNSPATNYFSIRPANVLVGPQASQVVRVTYRGPRMTPNELAFRIKAEQVEYSKGRKAGGKRMFNFLYNYVTSAYIQPQRPTEKLSVSACRPSWCPRPRRKAASPWNGRCSPSPYATRATSTRRSTPPGSPSRTATAGASRSREPASSARSTG